MASKTESTFINMVLSLFIVSLVASLTLGFVFKLTEKPIAAARLKKKLKAIEMVVPKFDNNPNDEMYMLPVPGNDSLECYPAKMGGELVGTAVRSYSDNGFTERIYVMVGMLPDGTVNNTSVLFHRETPGLGDKMTKKKSNWSKQFEGKKVVFTADGEAKNIRVTKDGGEIDAITAATISSRAFCDAVNTAAKTLASQK